MELKNLFSPGKIGNVEIKNRIVRSATYEKRATKDGHVTDKLVYFYTKLAQGGVGLIITGATAVDLRATGSPYQQFLFDDKYIAGQKNLTKVVHDYSEVKIAAQLHHAGRLCEHTKYEAVAPSPVYHKMSNKTPRELTNDEILELMRRFVDASRRAYESGYDMVQLHAAHGYLLSNFLSSYTNKREDAFGGSIQNKTKILVDICKLVKEEVDKTFPVIIKLQSLELIPEGITAEETKQFVKILVEAGFDAIEPSGGLLETMEDFRSMDMLPSKMVKKQEDENYFLPLAKEIKPLMQSCKLILMGGVRNPLTANTLIQEGDTDFVSLSRPLLHEPNLPNRWKQGDLSPVKCIYCNQCYMTIYTGEVHCVVRRKLEKKRKREKRKKNI